jgi:hypothetical protein
LNCKNYGNILGSLYGNNGLLIGYLYDGANVTINNFEANFSSDDNSLHLITATIRTDCRLKVNNFKINLQNGGTVYLLWSVYASAKAEISNVYITQKSKNQFKFAYLITSNFILKNVFVEAKIDKTVDTYSLYNKINDYIINFDGVVLNLEYKNGNKLRYYGTDFSDYFYDWKTGRMGLKTIEQVGTFKSQVTEDKLVNMGYSKIEFK